MPISDCLAVLLLLLFIVFRWTNPKTWPDLMLLPHKHVISNMAARYSAIKHATHSPWPCANKSSQGNVSEHVGHFNRGLTFLNRHNLRSLLSSRVRDRLAGIGPTLQYVPLWWFSKRKVFQSHRSVLFDFVVVIWSSWENRPQSDSQLLFCSFGRSSRGFQY